MKRYTFLDYTDFIRNLSGAGISKNVALIVIAITNELEANK